ncbi:MAG: serine--tRNA ligase [Sphingopyxis sp.]|nr:serine--tRNA ligase [Sphingopyxis sp.]
MHDIRLIRDNPAAFDAALARRGHGPVADAIVAMDSLLRELQTDLQGAQARRNEVSKGIGAAMGRADSAATEAMKAEVADIKDRMIALEAAERDARAALHDSMAGLPNLPADDVPDGADEAANVELSRWGTPRNFDFTPREHADIGPALGMDFETGALLSGARFTFLRGAMARLNRAIGQYMLDVQTGANGYIECATPYLVRDEVMFGTGQLPKFSEDLFQTTDGRWLIPTAEVSLTNGVREQILDAKSLPIRLTALTPCFRSEAGAAGRDTRGLIRQHQFEKVELVSITTPEDSAAEHERMIGCAEAILQGLGLPYRKLLLCAGDMGPSARKTYDLEVWLPGQNAYREISSCSNCGDYQARRMDTRYRPEGEKNTRFVHTLNGSGLAVGRTVVAIIENYQQADGSVTVPDALVPYMGGMTRLTP